MEMLQLYHSQFSGKMLANICSVSVLESMLLVLKIDGIPRDIDHVDIVRVLCICFILSLSMFSVDRMIRYNSYLSIRSSRKTILIIELVTTSTYEKEDH